MRQVKNDEYVEIIPLTFSRYRIVVTDGYSVSDGW
jgi:hypothetical protein